MPELPFRNPGEIIFSSFSNQLIRRSVQRYADPTERDFENPLPEVGDCAYLTTTQLLQVWDGTFWTNYAPELTNWFDHNPASIDLPNGSPGVEVCKVTMLGSNLRYQYLATAMGYMRSDVLDGSISSAFVTLEGDSGSVRETSIITQSHVTEPSPGSYSWSMPFSIQYDFVATEPSVTLRAYQANGTDTIQIRNSLLRVEQISAAI